MKKLQLLLLALLISIVGSSQISHYVSYYVDYSAASFDDSLTLWQLRSLDNLSDSNDINYASVSLTGPLAGYTDINDIENSVNEWSYFNGPITIDSLFAYASHTNYSGLTDTIIFQLVTLSNSYAPTNTIVYTDTIFTTQSLSINSNNIVRLKSLPNFTTTDGQKLGITIKYFGSTEDTFKLAAGYVKDNLGNVELGAMNYPNSYIQIKPHYNAIVKNRSILNYDSTPIKAQNWKLGMFVNYLSWEEWTSVKENFTLNSITLYPNPTQNNLNINLGKASTGTVSLQILNTFGQVVKTQFFDKIAGQNLTLDIAALPTGIYFAQVQAFGGSKTFKLIKD